MVPFRTQNLSLLNKCLSTIWAAKAVPSSFILGIHVLVPGNAHLLVTYHLETSLRTARWTRARLVLGVYRCIDPLEQSSGKTSYASLYSLHTGFKTIIFSTNLELSLFLFFSTTCSNPQKIKKTEGTPR